MSNLNLELDTQMVDLEYEWRHAYEGSIVARADYQSLASSSAATAELLDMARERMDRAEAMKARIMAKIELLEDSVFSRQ